MADPFLPLFNLASLTSLCLPLMDITNERISEFEDLLVETSQIEL